MEAVCAAISPLAQRQSELKTNEIVLLECRQHWALLILPMLGLLVWLAAGVFFARLIALSYHDLGPELRMPGPSLVLLMFMASAAIISLICLFSYHDSLVTLTNKRATLKTGDLFKTAGELDLGQAESVTIHESALGRLFNYGTVSIVGTGGAHFSIPFVPDPYQFHRAILKSIGNRWSKVDWQVAT